MPRRKRQMMDDDDSSGNSESDQDMADGDWNHKRQRKNGNGQEDATYGVFADDSDEEYGYKQGKGKERRKSDWTKAPAFVSGDKVDLKKTTELDREVEGSEGVEDSDADSSDDDEGQIADEEVDGESDDISRAPSLRNRDEDEEETQRPQFGKVGLGAATPAATIEPPSGFSRGGIGSLNAGIGSSKGGIGSSNARISLSKGGIGSSKGGLGSGFSNGGIGSAFTKGDIGSLNTVSAEPVATTKFTVPTTPHNSTLPASPIGSVPSAFGASTSRTQRSFLPKVSPSTNPSKPVVPLPAHEQAHFSTLTGFGAKMLNKMGWQAGTGLGSTGEGIVIPIESKLRPKGMGIAFKGFKEKTAQSKLEARRKGEVVSSDDDDDRPKRKGKGKKGPDGEKGPKASDAWKKPKKVKMKVEHKTYEQIVAEAAGDIPPPGIGIIIDATGATPREISSVADVSKASWTPSTDPTQIPEVRHNLRLIGEACKSDLDGLAREARELEQRKVWIRKESERLAKKIDEEAELIKRMQQITLIVDDITTIAKDLSSAYEVTLDPFSPLFSRLLVEFPNEFDKLRLDEIVVAAIAPVVRRMIANWSPLQEPAMFVSTFKLWKKALRLINEEAKQPETQVDIYGSKTYISSTSQVERPMTPFESLLWNVWLPKVRTTLNNDWTPANPTPALSFYEVWSSFLPPFVRDNLLDQLILPKLSKAVSDWSVKKEREGLSLQGLVFPWLPHLGLRMEELVGDARRKVKNMLRGWSAEDGVPTNFIAWKEVFSVEDWDAMLLKYVVPKLGAVLRNDFRVDPRNQDLVTLQSVLDWSTILRPSIFGQLLETEFFPKWLNVLYIWLITPKVNLAQVADWFEWWKKTLPENVRVMPVVTNGFTRGFQLSHKALELGPDAPTRLPHPDHISTPATTLSKNDTASTSKVKPSARAQQVTFRSVVEDFAASHNLLFIPTGQAHEISRMPLYRVSQTADGKGGLLVYIQDDAIWASDGDEYRAITPQDMVLKATR